MPNTTIPWVLESSASDALGRVFFRAMGWTILLVLLGILSRKLILISMRPRLSSLRHIPGPEPRGLSRSASDERIPFREAGFFHTLVGEFLGKGLLFSVGEEHKRLRRIVAGPLSRPSVRKLMPVFLAQSKKLNQELEDAINNDGEGIVEVEDVFTRASLNIPATINPSQPLAGQIISFLNPFVPLRWLPIPANLNFVYAKEALKTMMTELIDECTAEVLAARKDSSGQGVSDHLLARMIDASFTEDQRLPKQELIDITMQVIAAGSHLDNVRPRQEPQRTTPSTSRIIRNSAERLLRPVL
ncbi:Fc.00g094470.m01.CDS01 [Cosmosporella sp. VM-42]